MSENTGLDQPFYGGTGGSAPSGGGSGPGGGTGGTSGPPPGSGGGIGGGTPISVSSLVPGAYPVALGGHPYLLDLSGDNRVRHQPIPLLKQQFDSSALPGEQSLSHDILWRRPQESWHMGAGQTYLDKQDSDPARFRASKGVDVWTKYEFGLLQDVDYRWPAAGPGVKGAAVDALRYYVLDGGTLKHTVDLFSGGSVSMMTVTSPTAYDFAGDGSTVYLACGGSGLYSSTYGSNTSASYSSVSNARAVAYVRGRLMVAGGGTLWNVVASGAPPTPLLTLPNFNFGPFAESVDHIYIGANSASSFKGYVYKTAVKSEGTSLDVPSIALELPDGELVASLQGYLGFMIIGTNFGVRVAQVGGNGDLTLGGLIRTPNQVFALEPHDKFVYFGWSDFDVTTSGIGRLDLSNFTAPLIPAYASDLMAGALGTVSSISTIAFNTLVFTLQDTGTGHAPGIYTIAPTRKVASGYLDSGMISFGLPDPKVAYYVDVRYKQLTGAHKCYISTSDGGTFSLLGTHTASSGTSQFPVGQLKSDAFEIREELDRDATDQNSGPIITRHTLKGEPAADTGIWITAPLLITSSERLLDTGNARDPLTEIQFIEALRATQTLVVWQEGPANYQVIVDDYDWQGGKWDDVTGEFEGTCMVKLKVVV